MLGVLFLVQFNHLDRTMGFYWSYTYVLTRAARFYVLLLRIIATCIRISLIVFLQIFTRIMRSFHLAVGPKELQTGSYQEEYLDASKAAVLIVSLLVSSVLAIPSLITVERYIT